MRQALLDVARAELLHDGLTCLPRPLLAVQIEGDLDCPGQPAQLTVGERARLPHLCPLIHERPRV